MIKRKFDIEDFLLIVALGMFVTICISSLVIKQGYEKPTPTLLPTPSPTLTPVPTLLPTSTPEPSPTATPTMIIVPVTEPEVIINSVTSKEKEFIEFIYDEFYDEVIRVSHDTVTFYLGRKGNKWIFIDYCFG